MAKFAESVNWEIARTGCLAAAQRVRETRRQSATGQARERAGAVGEIVCNGFKVGPNYQRPQAPAWIDVNNPQVKSVPADYSAWIS